MRHSYEAIVQFRENNETIKGILKNRVVAISDLLIFKKYILSQFDQEINKDGVAVIEIKGDYCRSMIDLVREIDRWLEACAYIQSPLSKSVNIRIDIKPVLNDINWIQVFSYLCLNRTGVKPGHWKIKKLIINNLQ